MAFVIGRGGAQLALAGVLGCGGNPQESLTAGGSGSSSGGMTLSTSSGASTSDPTLDGGSETTAVSSTNASTTTDASTTTGGPMEGTAGSSEAATGNDTSATSKGDDRGDRGEESDDESNDGSSTTEAIACDAAVDPPGADECPTECTGGCNDDYCLFACDSDNACDNDSLVCPAGFGCEVTCAGVNACHHTTIACPEDYPCVVTCDGDNGCHDAIVQGSTGAVRVECGFEGNACRNLALTCGALDSVVECQAGQMFPPPVAVPGGCACDTMEC